MYVMEEYDAALRQIMKYGAVKTNRTGVKTRAVFGIMSRYRIDEAFPVLTGRKVWPKAIWGELLWFLSGSTNNKDLQAYGSNIWTPWVDPEFEKKHDYVEGAFGPVYGFQLRHFGGTYGDGDPMYSLQVGSELPNGDCHWNMVEYFGSGGFDQLTYVVNLLKQNPDDRRILFDLWNPKDLDKMRLPPCFVKGTPVLTKKGFKSIEEIEIGDFVYTSSKWDEVYEIHRTPYNGTGITFTVACLAGQPLTCTPNHPFWVKNKGWVEAKNIRVNDYLLIPKNTQSNDPIFSATFTGGKNRKPKKYKLTKDDWWLIGYYLGDGWTNKNRICFAVANKEKEYILPRIRAALKVSKKPQKIHASCQTYQTMSKKWSIILEELGNRAVNKKIPFWILDAPVVCLESLIDGYFDSDGCKADNNYDVFNSISKNLILGMQQIFWKIGRRASVNFHKRNPTCVIEGRTVNQRDFYSLTVKRKGSKVNKQNNFEFCEQGVWLRVKKKDELPINDDVFNLSVNNSHEYCTIVRTHNCHYTFQCYVYDGKLSGMLTQRSCDFPVGVPANIQFYSALIYMLAQQCGFEPYEFVHSTADSHIYEDQIPAIEEYLARPKPDSPRLVLNKARDIESYAMSDFQLEEYNPEPAIKIPVAV